MTLRLLPMGSLATDAAQLKIFQVFSPGAVSAASSAATAAAAKTQAAAQKAQAQANYQASVAAYKQSLSQLQPVWSPLPTAPYPPSGDTSGFPRTGTPGLFLSPAQVSAAQLDEPSKIVQAAGDSAAARVPNLNLYFLIGAACLVGYFVLRDK